MKCPMTFHGEGGDVGYFLELLSAEYDVCKKEYKYTVSHDICIPQNRVHGLVGWMQPNRLGERD